jgi:uncharacterized protein YqcC (DUF446 family)
MPPTRQRRLALMLTRIEAELRRLGLWSALPPPAAALQSTLPFCFDTLAFEQWLQWVFLPRFWALLQQGGPLPERSGIAPMAEVWFEDKAMDAENLIELLRAFDEVLASAE